MPDVSPHALIQSFISGLSDFITTLVPPGKRDTFTVSICAATGTSLAYTCDVDCTLVGCYMVQGGGNSNTIARSNVSTNTVPTTGTKTARQVIAFFQGTTIAPFIFCREGFKRDEKVWLVNGSAGTTVVLLVFES